MGAIIVVVSDVSEKIVTKSPLSVENDVNLTEMRYSADGGANAMK